MEQIGSITTKRASDMLGISPSTLRAYGLNMENLGYNFNKIDGARQFTKYDLQIISDALERFKNVGGTMKQSLRYAIVKAEQGIEVAET